MKKLSNAFTMIELVFVIVVLGILASVAIPKLAATRDDATIGKGRADIASVRSAIISERQSRLILGKSAYAPLGTGTYTEDSHTFKQINNGGLFGGILMYPIASSSGNDGWSSANTALGEYKFKVSGTSTTFTYTPADGLFQCTSGSGFCDELVN